MAFYKQARESGGDFDAGIRAGVARILASPSFLYRIERDPAGVRPGAAHPVSDVELASRLSFFLWSSIPDEKLLNLAVAGRLRAARRARRAGAAHDRGRARRRARQQLHRASGCSCATSSRRSRPTC